LNITFHIQGTLGASALINRIESRLRQVKLQARRVRLEEKYHELVRKLDEYGEEWLPTLLIAGTKASKNGQTGFNSEAS